MSLKRSLLRAVPLVLLIAAVGCQTGGSAPAEASAPAPQKAVVITTGQGTTAVYIPSTNNAGVELLAADKQAATACKQCEEDVKNYFKTGVISAKCPVCGATRVPLHAIN